jgi:3-methyl-2-oxobutanoate hydroxymethyltransferase
MTRSTDKVTVPSLRARKRRGPKIAAVTAYDATFARLLEQGGADILLVGDSLGMVIQGQSSTLPVTLDEICYHGRAVARAAQRAHVVGDLPFMSYQASIERGVEAAGKLLKEGGCEAVKLEGGEAQLELVARLVRIGIPVMGHVGLLPQAVHAMGGYRVQGKAADAAEQILRDAELLDQAGVYSIVVEGVPAELGRRITERVDAPTIGIGAGPDCDGQVLVCYDYLGMYTELKPKFVKRYAELGQEVVRATERYVEEVRRGAFPSAAESFGTNAAKDDATGAAAVLAASDKSYGPTSEDGS